VFWAEGYEATSMQDLVEAMGINRGSLYGTFGGKRALFLAALDAVILANLGLKGAVTVELLLLALAVSLPYVAMTMVGQALFDPAHERLYRRAAYAVIALAVASGLPLWNTGG